MLLEVVVRRVADRYDDENQQHRFDDGRENAHDGENQPEGDQNDNNHPHCFDHRHREPLS